jgi:hypothetical protein
VQGKNSAHFGAHGGRQGFLRLRAPAPNSPPSGRHYNSVPAPRLRQQRPAPSALEEELKTSGRFDAGVSTVSWVILLGGLLLAIGGVVHASWPSGERSPAGTSIAEGVLTKQIAQLKAELDRERAEKAELMASAAMNAPAPASPAAAASVQTAVQTVVPAEAQSEPDQGQAGEPESSLPEPMAPSVELLLSDLPVSSVPVESDGPGAAPAAYGIHLASFADRTMAERGWQLLQRNHPSALGSLKPRIEEAQDDKGTPVFLLIAGPFKTEELAAAHCKKINTQVVFCKPRPFVGSELAVAIP